MIREGVVSAVLTRAVVVLAVLIHELLNRCIKGAHSRVAQHHAPSSRRGHVVMDGPGLPRRTIPSRGAWRGCRHWAARGPARESTRVPPGHTSPSLGAVIPGSFRALDAGRIPPSRRDLTRRPRRMPRKNRHPTLTRGRDQSAEPGVNPGAQPTPTRGRAVPRAQASTRTRASMSALSAPTSFSRSMTRCCPPSIPSNLSGTGGR